MAEKGGDMGSKTSDEIPDIFLEPLQSMKDGDISQAIDWLSWLSSFKA